MQKLSPPLAQMNSLVNEQEGITWDHINFTDNEQTLQLIDARMGIISVLNEECMRPMGNDEAFTSKLTTLHTKHPDLLGDSRQ